MKQINLNILENGSTGLSQRNGGFLGEAASVCLDHHGHPTVVVMPAIGHFKEDYELTCFNVNDLSRSSFADIQEATEYGACGIALSIIASETGFITRRSVKGTGFDYWLGEQSEDFPFQDFAKLEVSGIIRGNDQLAGQRLSDKLGQATSTTAGGSLPAYAVVVEFSNPKTLSGKR